MGLAGSILTGEIEPALRELNDLARNGKDLGRLLGDLLNHFRNLLIYQVSRGDLKLLEVSEAEASALAEQVKSVDTGALTRIMEVLSDCEGTLRNTASKKILIEVALLKSIQARNAVPIDTVLRQLQQLRGEGGAGVSPGAAANPRPAAAPAAVVPALKSGSASHPVPALAPTVAATETSKPAAVSTVVGNSDLAPVWAQLLEAVGRASPFTRSYLLEAHPVSFDRGVFIIGFDPEFADHLGLVDNSKNHALLQTKLAELGHPGAMVKFIKAEAPSRPPIAPVTPPESVPASKPPTITPAPLAPGQTKTAPAAPRKTAPVPFNQDDFKNDPLIKKALEIFKGQIVDVRA